MMCQDPHITENADAEEANTRQPDVHESPLDEAGVEWFRHDAFRDKRITDEDLGQALRRGAPGDVTRLVLCSSKLTDSAVQAALEPHWLSLTELCVCNCGLSGGLLTGAFFSSLVQVCYTRLRTLILIDIPKIPMNAVAACCELQTLMLRGSLSAPSVEPLSRCKGLQTLRLSLQGKVQQDSFIRVFTECRKLRVVDIHGATDVSDQLLACLMLNVPGLEDFCGSHAGNHLSCSHVLTGHMTEAFKAHFTSAKRIFIDNLVCDSLL